MIWTEIGQEIDKKISLEKQKLLSCSPEELREIQLIIACYESLKNLPDDVIYRES